MKLKIELKNVSKIFPSNDTPAVDKINAKIFSKHVTGLIGPDGAGKTTILRMMASLLMPTSGSILIEGIDFAKDSLDIHDMISYMPQKFGLYEDLTVMENLNLYADLRGVLGDQRDEIFDKLLDFTSLKSFINRFAGRLSGGMKQKLGLACSLIQRPKILLLDEPSVGVDPISRRELWNMVYELVDDGIAVVWSTSYLDEAERCSSVLVMNNGKLLYNGAPSELTNSMIGRSFFAVSDNISNRQLSIQAFKDTEVLDSVIQGKKVRLVLKGNDSKISFNNEIKLQYTKPRFEDFFMSLLGGVPKEFIENIGLSEPVHHESSIDKSNDIVVEAKGLTKCYGNFTAVDNINFKVNRGEVFGILGPNGAGKSTTFKMMCGLAVPTKGDAKVNGIDLLDSPSKAREYMGYMAQKFSLYGDLSVNQNLKFFSGIYGLSGKIAKIAIEHMIKEFELKPFLNTNASMLPLGFKQRLSMACATMHKPPILFLDEPTSGVDPITRREFWMKINSLVEKGTSVIVTTHFLDEAEYCDHIALMYRGRIIAMDTPDNIRESVRSEKLPDPDMEDAFVKLIEQDIL